VTAPGVTERGCWESAIGRRVTQNSDRVMQKPRWDWRQPRPRHTVNARWFAITVPAESRAWFDVIGALARVHLSTKSRCASAAAISGNVIPKAGVTGGGARLGDYSKSDFALPGRANLFWRGLGSRPDRRGAASKARASRAPEPTAIQPTCLVASPAALPSRHDLMMTSAPPVA
jgi:hypothetical protein